MIAKDSKDVPSSSEACSGGRLGRCQMEEGASWPRWTEREGMDSLILILFSLDGFDCM